MRPPLFLFLLLLGTYGFPKTELKIDTSFHQVQVCLVLDVSGSMDGLISQAQNELWKVISFIESYQYQGKACAIELAVITYGNGAYEKQHFIRIQSDFESNLDRLVEELVSIQVTGSNEFCGFALKSSFDSLSWSSENIYKMILIAGNEPFDQGAYDYRQAIDSLRTKQVIVNTILCGNEKSPEALLWQEAAALGNGEFATIDQDIEQEKFKTPYDSKLVKFYLDYKSTFIEEHTSPFDIKTPQYDDNGDIPPAFRDKIIYKYYKSRDQKDLIDKLIDSGWDMNVIDKEFPDEFKGIDKQKLFPKLHELKRKREVYQEGFELYNDKVLEYLQVTVGPQLEQETLGTALEKIIIAQMEKLGYHKE